ncbi:MAG: ABC transporter permease [Clostridium sp.]|nr:ABC transporter permease [Clostridium sp.]MCM1443711.1 ABC transporter permease [Candidatus Amulumruptor caecigallinarius]
MYILKNALTSIVRNKGRNLLIGIIILVISCSVSVTLAINNSSDSLIKSYESKYEVEATIGMNRENMMQNFNPEDRENSKDNMKEMFDSASTLTEEDIKNFADSDYVKSYYYTMQTGVNSDTLEKASISSSNMPDGRGPNGKENFKNESSGDFTLKGYSSTQSMNEFIEGSYSITDGEVSDDFDSNYCLINSELATLNEIKVGDTIKIVDSDDDSKTYELIVSGIYEEKMDNDNGMSMFTDSVNTIITNTNFISKMKENNEDLNVSITPTFVLTSSDVVETFNEELTEKGLNENLTIETNLDQVKNATSTISNVKTFAITFLIITLIIGTVVLLVINMINIRERKYEIGVLRTIGMKKSKVCLQFISELFIVAFISLILGAGIGATMSVPISNNLLQNEISSSQNEANNIRDNFGKGQNGDSSNIDMQKPNNDFLNNRFKGVATIQAFNSIDAVVDFKVLIELLGIGLLITLISSVTAITSIQKFSPLTILKERS